jgi:hypothetical protein
MRQLYTPTSLNCIRMDGGTYVQNPPSAFDVFGSSYIICDKHPDKHIPVGFDFSSLDHNILTLQKAAIEALQRCPGCLEAESYKNTRFPEGSEL